MFFNLLLNLSVKVSLTNYSITLTYLSNISILSYIKWNNTSLLRSVYVNSIKKKLAEVFYNDYCL